MLPVEEQTKLSDMMERHELAISALYKAFAKQFPKYKMVWQKLAAAEIGHAEQIRVFQARIKAGDMTLNEGHQKALGQLEASLKRVSNETDRATRGHLSLIDAVSFARELEQSMLENNWFKCYTGDSDLLRRVMEALHSETQAHCKELDRLFVEVGGPEAARKGAQKEDAGSMQRLPED